MDSFDHYGNGTWADKWFLGGTPGDNMNIAAARNGNGYVGVASGRYLWKVFDNQATWIVGAAWKTTATPNNYVLIGLRDDTSQQFDVRFTTNGGVRVTRDGTQLGSDSANGLIPLNAWIYLEFKVTINNSTGSYEVRINGVTALSGSGVDTQATGNAYANRVYFTDVTAFGGSTTSIDDVYILDGTGSVNNDFLGDVKVEALFPSGNGNSSQLVGQDADSTNNYLNVDETSPNGDTDYNESATTGNKDTYAFGNLATTAGSVYGVQVLPYARKTDAGTRSIASVARLSATEVDSSDKTLSTTYQLLPDVRETKPGGGGWTISDVNGAEFGVKVTA